jgi:hypothetical protein
MARRIAAIVIAVAGIWLLAGPGWALLCLGVLVEVGWPRERAGWLEGAADRSLRALRALHARVWAIPKQIGAVVSAGSGMALVPLGIGLSAGLGPALIVAGMLALGAGLLLDRTA